MALVNVKDEGGEDFRNKPRWSANKKLDAVMRLLRGETVDEVSRDCEDPPRSSATLLGCGSVITSVTRRETGFVPC